MSRAYLRWLAGATSAVYAGCRDDSYPVAGNGQYRLQAAWNAVGWAWHQWWKWDRPALTRKRAA